MSNDAYNLAVILGTRCANVIEDLLTCCDEIKSAKNLDDRKKDALLLPIVSTFASVLARCSGRLGALYDTYHVREPED